MNGLYQDSDLQSVLNHIGYVSAIIDNCRNSSTPVRRLPVELLSNIFLLVSALDPPKFPRKTFRLHYGGSLGWIHLAHVCRQWRAIALSTPGLWAQCVFSLPKGCETRLALSGEAALTIMLNTSHKFTPSNYVKAASSCATRAHTITLQDSHITSFHDECEDRSFEGVLWSCWRDALSAVHLPLLNSLSVARPLKYLDRRSSSAIRWPIQALIAPRLHSVYFKDTFIPFSSSTLTRLEIYCLTIHEDICAPDDLLSILEIASTTLQILVLSSWFPDLQDVSRSRGAISLPHLSTLKLTGSDARCIALKRCLDVPPTTDLQLRLSDPEYDEDAPPNIVVGEPFYYEGIFSKVVDAFQEQLFQANTPRRVVRLALAEEDSAELVMSLQEFPEKAEDYPSMGGLKTAVYIRFTQLYGKSPEPLCDMCFALARLTASQDFSHLETNPYPHAS